MFLASIFFLSTLLHSQGITGKAPLPCQPPAPPVLLYSPPISCGHEHLLVFRPCAQRGDFLEESLASPLNTPPISASTLLDYSSAVYLG